MAENSEKYIPALGYAPFTRFYDLVVGLTTREATFKKELIAQASPTENSKVLDVACGTGTLILLLKINCPNATVIGIDGDSTILEIARKKIKKAGASIQLDKGFSNNLPYGDGEFDIVMSSLFFHHLSSEMKKKTAEEMFRVIRPGGMIHIADWGKPDNKLMSLLFYSIQLLDGFKNTDDNRKGLLPEIFKSAGFDEVKTQKSFSTIFGTMVLYSGKKN